MTDIVDELRSMATAHRSVTDGTLGALCKVVAGLADEAAAEIERLRIALATARSGAQKESAKAADDRPDNYHQSRMSNQEMSGICLKGPE